MKFILPSVLGWFLASSLMAQTDANSTVNAIQQSQIDKATQDLEAVKSQVKTPMTLNADAGTTLTVRQKSGGEALSVAGRTNLDPDGTGAVRLPIYAGFSTTGIAYGCGICNAGDVVLSGYCQCPDTAILTAAGSTNSCAGDGRQGPGWICACRDKASGQTVKPGYARATCLKSY